MSAAASALIMTSVSSLSVSKEMSSLDNEAASAERGRGEKGGEKAVVLPSAGHRSAKRAENIQERTCVTFVGK